VTLSVAGPIGKTMTRGGETSLGPGRYGHSRSYAGPHGATSARSVSRRYAAASDAYSSDISRTGPNGEPMVWQTEASR
jgi:hypothetical protein